MGMYYKSRLSSQIESGLYGIENMDYKYLAAYLIENETEQKKGSIICCPLIYTILSGITDFA
jgi:hypothetical protein